MVWVSLLTRSTTTQTQQSWLMVPLLAIAFWLAASASALAQLELRVAVLEDVATVEVGSSTPAIIRNESGQVISQLTPQSAVEVKQARGGLLLQNLQANQFWVEPTQGGYVWIGNTWYRGRVLVTSTGRGVVAVNYVDLEHYLYSVLGAEMGANWPLEALKAQAVAARSYALYQRDTYGNATYDVGDTQAWQVYKGISSESVNTQIAVNATAGQVLIHNGNIIEAVFHSSSGGHTDNSENVWTKAMPYLRGVPAYDEGAPGSTWSVTFSAEQLSERIPGVGRVRALVPERMTPFGRVLSVRVVGDAGTRSVSGESIRSALGLRSTRFSVGTIGNEIARKQGGQTASAVFQLVGSGFGHGLGMSQWGAYNLAQRGFTYQQIVQHYYQGASLAKIQVQ
jgi:stage II sporulation protein D